MMCSLAAAEAFSPLSMPSTVRRCKARSSPPCSGENRDRAYQLQCFRVGPFGGPAVSNSVPRLLKDKGKASKR